MSMQAEAFVQCENLIKIYQVADVEAVALQGLNLEIEQGEMLALVGPSGVGKSTLLNVLGGLDTPSAGSVQVAGWDLLRMGDRERVRYKRQVVGFVWQQPARNLLSYLSARENVELPMQQNRVKPEASKQRALELLDVVGLAGRADNRPEQLSGGEQQRVALAIALANNPPLLLGDELTGQVDSESAMQVLDALQAINQAYGTTAIIVTHDPLVAGRVDRVVTMRDGRTSTEIRRRNGKDGSLHEEEWVILDPVGRLQLPRTHVNALEMREMVKVHLEPDHLSVWAKDDGARVGVEAEDEGPKHGMGQTMAWHATESGGATKGGGVPIRVEGLTRTFELAGEEVHALREVTLTMPAGCLNVVKGPSGSGKTTLFEPGRRPGRAYRRQRAFWRAVDYRHVAPGKGRDVPAADRLMSFRLSACCLFCPWRKTSRSRCGCCTPTRRSAGPWWTRRWRWSD